MDEEVTAVKVDLQGNLTTSAIAENVLSLQQVVCNAAELGWGITELLGRCFALKEAPPAKLAWERGDKLVAFQENYTPREKIDALIVYIRFLADSLGVSSCKITNEGDRENGRPYIDVLEEKVERFIQHDPPASSETHEQLLKQINERLFFWDLKIHDVFQSRPTAVHKSYLVGRSLAALRWYFGLLDKTPDNNFMKKVQAEYVPLMQPYLSTFAPGALSNSFEPWWNAVSGDKLRPGPPEEAPLHGLAPKELREQADIWYSLLTNEREAFSYAHPTTRDRRRYILRVLRVFLPFLLIGGIVVLLILALLLYVILSNFDMIVKEISAVIGLVVAFVISHNLLSTIGGILERAVSEVSGTIKGSMLDTIRFTNQQEEVNEGTLIPPAIADQQGS
jgi:hypothetical protein